MIKEINDSPYRAMTQKGNLSDVVMCVFIGPRYTRYSMCKGE